MRTYVYRTFDAAGNLLYIGCSNNVVKRISQHIRRGTGGGEAVARYEVQGYPTRGEAMKAEAQAIAAERPPANIRGGLREGVNLSECGNPDGGYVERFVWEVAQEMIAQGKDLPAIAVETGIPLVTLSRKMCGDRVKSLDVNEVAAISTVLGLPAPELFRRVDVAEGDAA